jgi:hypothetical protein
MPHQGFTNRFSTGSANPAATAGTAEEALVTDSRAGLTPAQMVERKLVSLLQSTPLPRDRQTVAGPRRPVS